MQKNRFCLIFLFLLCILIIFVGCDTTQNPENNNDSINPSDSNGNIEGGPNGYISGTYYFETYNDYKDFYNIFINYNEERYLVPCDSNEDFEFEYKFLSEGVSLSDYNDKRFDIDFDNQTMYVNIIYKADDSFNVEGICLNYDDSINLENIEYSITENDGTILLNDERLILRIFSGNNLIYIGRIAKTINLETIDFVSNKLLNSFKID